MHLQNATSMAAGYTLGMDPAGREHLLVVVKGTFRIPEGPGAATLADAQEPIVEADTFTGEPGFSATIYESDYALRKPACDVVLHGSAYAPGGRPATRVPVRMRVGPIDKGFDVVGDRTWRRHAMGVKPTKPEPFAVMPISYDRAFGGTDDSNPDKVAPYFPNPVGVGYRKRRKRAGIIGTPLPNTEEPKSPVTKTTGKYRPTSFGPVGRSWPTRVQYAGTYDGDWLDDVFPFLPKDFDDRYFQCAPPEQQMDHPKGGERVELVNLTPEGQTVIELPTVDVPVEFTFADWQRTETNAVIDTVIIEPDQRRFMLVWRASTPLQKNIFDIASVVVGRMPRGWYRARRLGKTYYQNLKELVDANRGLRS